MDTPYILSDLGDIQFEVDGMHLIMKLKPGVISGLGGGTVIDIIKSIDLKEATDLNVFSSLRVLSEITKAVGSIDVSGSYLRKDVEDTAAEQISFGKGIKIGNATLTWDAAAGALRISESVFSDKEVSAYGFGSDNVNGESGSLGSLVNVGQWADEVASSDRVIVQLAGATHWSSMLLSEIVGLDTVALSAYLTTNKYTTETYVNTKVAELVGSSPATLDTLNELAAALGNDPNFATSITTLIGTKWTQDNTKIANWDSAYNALHSHTNKTELDGITSTLITNWNLAYTNSHTHPNKSIIDSLTQANLDVLSKLSIVDGNLKVDTNLWSTGEVSAYGAGSGSGGGGGLISSVLGSAGLGGSYLDSDLTNTFNAYTINLINTNLTGALGRIGALETSTPNVAWGTPTSQYSPLTINSVTRNLSLDGHTHSYLPLTGGNLTGGLTINSNTVWHAGNDGAGSGLDADLLDGQHGSFYFNRNTLFNANNVDYNAVNYEIDHGVTTQPIHLPNYTGAVNAPFSSYGQMVHFDGNSFFPFRIAFDYLGRMFFQGAGYKPNGPYNYSNGTQWFEFFHSGNSNKKTVDWNAKDLTLNGSITGLSTIVRTNANAVDEDVYGNLAWKVGTPNSNNWNVGTVFYVYKSGNIMIGNSLPDSGYKLDVAGTSRFSDTMLTKNIIFNSDNTWGNLGSVRCTWGNDGGYPTLYGSSAERWVMHINPHISYVQNGIGEYTGTINGATIRFAGNTDASIAWDLGVGCNSVGSDKFSIGRSGTSFFKIANDAHAFFDGVLESTSRIFSGFDSGAQGSISCSNWFRSSGATGWYNQTYGGGMTMDDYTYVKVSHNKSLWVNGNIVATGEVTAYSASDLRLKTEVATLKDSLRIIELLNPVSYKWNSIAKELNPMKGDEKDYGLIAQELETVMPELVHSIYDGKYKSIDYMKLIPHLICAIKELKMEIDHLKKTYY